MLRHRASAFIFKLNDALNVMWSLGNEALAGSTCLKMSGLNRSFVTCRKTKSGNMRRESGFNDC